MKSEPFTLIKGQLQIEISGAHPERLINLALREGIALSDVQHQAAGTVSCRILLADIYRLRGLTRTAQCRLHIVGRRGLPFKLAFMRKRPLLLVMMLLGTLLLAFASSIAWQVEVTSPYELSSEDKALVGELAEQAGILAYHSRWLMDLDGAEQYILSNFHQLIYAEIYSRGSSLMIHVVKRVDAPKDAQTDSAGNLVASAAGVICDVLVRRGTAAVAPGDVVEAGQVLIYSYFGNSLVAADGIVTATIYAEGYGECAEQEELVSRSGAFQQQVLIKSAGGAALCLAGTDEPSYAEYETVRSIETLQIWRKIDLPVEVILVQHYELERTLIEHGSAGAQSLARERSQNQAILAFSAMQAGEPLSDLTLSSEFIETGDGIARYRTVAEAVVEIGVFRQLTEQQQADYGSLIAGNSKQEKK